MGSRSSRPWAARLRAAACLLPLAAAPATAGTVDPHAVASAISSLGPRLAGTTAHAAAVDLLASALADAGLAQVAVEPVAGAGGARNVSGLLPGTSGLELILAAHLDTVPGSPGAGDDASGCAVVTAAAADLARTPLSHAVRVVLFDGEEQDLTGSRGWIAARSPAERDRILAVLVVDMVGWRDSPGATLLGWPAPRAGGAAMVPGWLVHAALLGSRAAGWELAITDPRLPLLAQLVARNTRPAFAADSDSFLAAGVPAVLLTDSSWLATDPAYHLPDDRPERLDAERLAGWSHAVASIVRRLDGLEGRPRPEEEYLVIAGRVWHRRDLYWVGFALWVVLVARGLPGRWRGAAAAERRIAGARYLPGFAFRMLYLLALFAAPALALPILAPAAVVSAVAPRRRWRWWAGALGLAPALVLSAAFAASLGRTAGALALPVLPSLAIAAALAAFCQGLARGPTGAATARRPGEGSRAEPPSARQSSPPAE